MWSNPQQTVETGLQVEFKIHLGEVCRSHEPPNRWVGPKETRKRWPGTVWNCLGDKGRMDFRSRVEGRNGVWGKAPTLNIKYILDPSGSK